jgi:hypothetical protein
MFKIFNVCIEGNGDRRQLSEEQDRLPKCEIKQFKAKASGSISSKK